MVCNVITADKANRLFWLGRYAERVYISLHLLRRYYDRVLDGDASDLREYYECLGVDCTAGDPDSEQFQIAQLYDTENVNSIASTINYANDNGIFVRQDITSESLSYIQMSLGILNDCASRSEKNISELQAITDYMLAFFGSVDERVFDERIRKFIKVGRLIENIDLHVRFNYPYFRIEEVYLSLKEYSKRSGTLIDPQTLSMLDKLISEDQYNNQTESYKETLLGCLNCLKRV